MPSAHSGDQRAYAGVTVTLRERATGELRVEHYGGFAYIQHVGFKPQRRSLTQEDALRAVCRQADGWEGDWCVQCISTPASILSDITKGQRPGTTYEQQLLSRIDRLDMLDGAQSQTARNRNRRQGKRHA